jgi:hypothetical protein
LGVVKSVTVSYPEQALGGTEFREKEIVQNRRHHTGPRPRRLAVEIGGGGRRGLIGGVTE